MGKLNRRIIRSRLLEQGLSTDTHVDGTISVHTEDSQRVVDLLNEWGFQPRLVPAKKPDTICLATAETVVQGLVGAHGYRGEGQYALRGEQHEAYAAGGLPTPEPSTEEERERAARNRRNAARRAARAAARAAAE
jgi:hypothetical protein